MNRSVGGSQIGAIIARNLRETRPKAHSRWHQMYMWRAVDSEGEVLEILVQPQRDKAAALRLLRKLLRREAFVPAVIVTDKLRSYGAALRKIGFSGLHEQDCVPTIERRTRINRSGGANERCKVSNQPNRLSALFPSTRRFTTRSTCNGI
jgi:transposase-like protein